MRRWLGCWGVVLVVALPAAAHGQLFFASRPDPGFSIGPLTIRAGVRDAAAPVEVRVVWGVVLPARLSPAAAAQDLYLLWPGEVSGLAGPAAPDPALARHVAERGFEVVGEGRLPLSAQSLRAGEVEAVPGGAPFVVFVQYDALGLSPPATLIRLPWSPRMADPGWLMELVLKGRGLVKPSRASWLEDLVVGGRYRLTLSFHEVRDRPLFAMYLAHRDRVVRLADAPAELVAQFAHADRLKIDEVFPPTSIRRLSESLETTEVVSLFLDRADAFTPQNLAVRFGYFSRTQALVLVAIPALFFILGQALGPALGRAAVHGVGVLAARVHLGGPRRRESGVILAREALERIVPGQSTRQDVLRLCGEEVEEQEELAAPHRRVLVYRGRRLVPEARRVLGWLATVRHWDVERHEVRIELERDVVRDLQALVRRYRLTGEEPP